MHWFSLFRWKSLLRELTSYLENEYDSKGNRTKESSYDADGVLSSYSVYEYDSKGNQTKESSHDADGELVLYYEYDSKGNQTKVSAYILGTFFTYTYTYKTITVLNINGF